MKLRIIKTIYLTIFIIGIFSSCEVKEGEGGTAKISGTVERKYYDQGYTNLLKTAPSTTEDVFIKYGTSKAINDRVRTSETGYFEFEYLHEGNYTIMFSSEDSTSGENQYEIIEINIGKGEHKQLGSLSQLKMLDWDDGTSSITGRILEKTYYSFPFIKDTVPSQEREVYLRYNDGISYVERIRTDYDGYFEFPNLIPGKFEVYVYSDDFYNDFEKIVVNKEYDITEFTDSIYDLGNFYIDNL